MPEITAQRPRRAVVSHYRQLLDQVKEAGLLGRHEKFYIRLLVILFSVLASVLTVIFMTSSWWIHALCAVGLAIISTQFAFVAHEASHRQVFSNNKANDRLGKFLANAVVGISYSWWMNKHTRHHANPNQRTKDPDIQSKVLAFHEDDLAGANPFKQWFLRHQGTLFFPLLLLEGLNLHVQGMRYLLNPREKISGRGSELAILTTRLALIPVLFFTFLPWTSVVILLVTQVGLFGVYMGASFAPNHKGMPQVSSDIKLDFFSKQVLTSRNVAGFGMSTLLGGLNYQVEHHLFPSMARPNLAKARNLVITHCHKHRVPYTEVGLIESYRAVITYLNTVGKSDRDIFFCPMITQNRTH